jgi:excisionase family DNA binding protein
MNTAAPQSQYAAFFNNFLRGYFLRVSERNGYKTPWSMFVLSGITQNETRAIRLPIEKMAPVLSRPLGELEAIAYYNGSCQKSCRLLGNSLHFQYLRLQRPSICPECISEIGFIEAHWELSYMVGCPVHRKRQLSHCPACQKALRWFRPGLLKCTCGYNLLGTDRPPMPQEEVELLDIIRRKVLNVSRSMEYRSNLPYKQLDAINLSSIIAIVFVLGSHGMNLRYKHTSDTACQAIVATAAKRLSMWPDNFFSFLDELVDSSTDKRIGASCGALSSIYVALMRTSRIQEGEQGAFLREAFSKFRLYRWKQEFPTRSHQIASTERFISSSELAKRLGVRQHQINRMCRKGFISSKVIHIGKYIRREIDSFGVDWAPASPGRVMRITDAVPMLGVSHRLFKLLKRSGVFEIKHMRGLKIGVHELDVISFIERMKSLVVQDNTLHLEKSIIPLPQALHELRAYPAIQVKCIAAIMSGELRLVGHTGGNLKGFLVSGSDFADITQRELGFIYGDTLSRQEAANVLRCHLNTIEALVRNKMLAVVRCAGRSRISRTSVEQFAKTYVQASALAMDTGTKSRWLIRCCEDNDIWNLVIRWNDRRQTFVRREDMQKIVELCKTERSPDC